MKKKVNCKKCYIREAKAKELCNYCYGNDKYNKYRKKGIDPKKTKPQMEQHRVRSYSDNECWKIISRWYKNNLNINLTDLGLLIGVYESLGGQVGIIDHKPPGEQLDFMWKFVDYIYKSKYEKIIELDIL